MTSINKVILIGNVGNNIKIVNTKNDKEMAMFSLATSKKWKDKESGEYVQNTEWHNIIVYAPYLIELIKNNFTTGSKVFIEGSLKTNIVTTSEGIEKKYVNIIVTQHDGQIILFNNKPLNENTNVPEEVINKYDASYDDIPF